MSRAADFELAFREAVGSAAYGDAGSLLRRYLAVPGPLQELARVRELIGWATNAVRVSRAHDAALLDRLERARRYLGPPVPAPPTRELRG